MKKSEKNKNFSPRTVATLSLSVFRSVFEKNMKTLKQQLKITLFFMIFFSTFFYKIKKTMACVQKINTFMDRITLHFLSTFPERDFHIIMNTIEKRCILQLVAYVHTFSELCKRRFFINNIYKIIKKIHRHYNIFFKKINIQKTMNELCNHITPFARFGFFHKKILHFFHTELYNIEKH